MEFLTVPIPEAANSILQAEIEHFSKQKGQPVTLSRFEWDDIWHELVNVGIYRRGPDIAEIGSTWLESLVAMQSLYAFSPNDITGIGGQEAFFPAAWQNIALANQKEIWGIPFRTDLRVIFYWKDIFEQASVDASEAFSTTENMTAAFTKLQQKGITSWVVPTNDTHNTVYITASWVWGAGGNFLSPDGKRTEFGSSTTLRGLQAYFDLFRFMPVHTSPMTDNDALEFFFERKSAATVAGPWLLNTLRMKKDGEKLLSQLGIALMPGPAFVGGTILVIWKHGKHWSDAVGLIKQLTSLEFQLKYCQISGLLPVRQDLWTDQFIGDQEYLAIFNKAIRTGRGLPPIALWGMVEDRLAKTMGAIWQELRSLEPSQKSKNVLERTVARHFETLSARLDITLSE